MSGPRVAPAKQAYPVQAGPSIADRIGQALTTANLQVGLAKQAYDAELSSVTDMRQHAADVQHWAGVAYGLAEALAIMRSAPSKPDDAAIQEVIDEYEL